MNVLIRPACEADADAISRVVIAALRTSNARDYSADVIERVAQGFSPSAIAALMHQRHMFVAVAGERVIGTASLAGGAIRSVFVDPDWHRQGVGRLLMATIEGAAREAGEDRLVVPSSLTAQAFYAALGFKVVREQQEGEERTLIMERSLRV
ncbi:GNAT family N-acetyltransferase [Pseudomonas syringae]|uniref:GNAT family N-acetyltransferase n=1 Tax=Pseudomonas syringae TaxID=317 RepID=A0A244EL05_PSESX|nr:GNAT family N-acetyltransferase [Pseudomonas syringae]MCI3947126.1 GNAT family N-acetyltransferase [Pseudomonas syringae]OUM05147.1 GNAT family N-acetyltransferase [Pseudomonas syringae]